MVETKPAVCHPWRSEPGAWVQIESREAAAERFVNVAEAIADTAEDLGDAWPEGIQDFARAELAASYWSTGLREDIERGRTRGPGGEACLMDLKPDTLRRNADVDVASLPKEQMIAAVVGLDPAPLHKCFSAGARALLAARRAKRWVCSREEPLRATFALYHVGSACTSAGLGWKWCPECKRADSVRHWRQFTTAFPDWYKPQAEASL